MRCMYFTLLKSQYCTVTLLQPCSSTPFVQGACTSIFWMIHQERLVSLTVPLSCGSLRIPPTAEPMIAGLLVSEPVADEPTGIGLPEGLLVVVGLACAD